jgi:catechol 2,3-dioxygenase-like lactoylglutathione lyase family enzyme
MKDVAPAVKLESMCPLLEVFDMPTSIAFYRDLLGFEVSQAAPSGDDCDWCLLERDGLALMLNTQYERDRRPPAPDPKRAAAHGDVSLFFACRDLDAAYEHLRARGVVVEPPVVRDYGMRQLSFFDPDGYNLCLQWAAG